MAKRLKKKKEPTSIVNEGNLYDKIFKEDAEEIFLPLIEMKLGVKIKSFKPFKAKMQTTLEREMDFFYEVETIEDKKLLVHIEFQTEDDMEILYRKGEYHGIALNLKKMEIKHIVIYLGIKEPLMPTKLPEEQVYRGFDLIDVHALDHQQLLESQVPDVIILAVLADYPPEKAESVLRLILRQLKIACKSTSELSKYIKQLVVLSRLRKIEDLTIKITEDMPISYDVETDYLYKKGTEKGTEIGIEKKNIDVIRKARLAGLSIDIISNIVSLSPERVREVLDDLKIK
jgi:hypothetical protein